MTTATNTWPEPDNQTVARRLRMHMGDVKLTRSKLSDACGISRASLASKLDGEVPFTMEEIVRVAHAINRSWLWVLIGMDPTPPDGPGTSTTPADVLQLVRPTGTEESRLGESNPRPIHYTPPGNSPNPDLDTPRAA